VPPNPGNVSAFGLLTVDVRNDYVRTHVVRQDRLDLDRLREVYAELQVDADRALEREGFAAPERRFVRTADLRYYGQAFEVRVEVANGDLSLDATDRVAQSFHDQHRRLYGYDFADDPRQQVEWVNIRVTGIGPIRSPEVVPIGDGSGGDQAWTGSRRAYFEQWADVPTYERSKLGAGDVLDGPAVIEEFGSTVPLHPGFRAEVDRYGNLRIARTGS
jgi:N-methylhydantoinase A